MQLLQLNQTQINNKIKHKIKLTLTSTNHFLHQQQNTLNTQLTTLFQNNSKPLNKIHTHYKTLLQTTQNTINHNFTLHFTKLKSTLYQILTNIIHPIKQQIKIKLNKSKFHPKFHFPIFHNIIPHFNTHQLFNTIISHQNTTNKQNTHLNIIHKTFSH